MSLASPIVWFTAIGAIVAAAILAAWRPALSAMRTDPLVLLRNE